MQGALLSSRAHFAALRVPFAPIIDALSPNSFDGSLAVAQQQAADSRASRRTCARAASAPIVVAVEGSPLELSFLVGVDSWRADESQPQQVEPQKSSSRRVKLAWLKDGAPVDVRGKSRWQLARQESDTTHNSSAAKSSSKLATSSQDSFDESTANSHQSRAKLFSFVPQMNVASLNAALAKPASDEASSFVARLLNVINAAFNDATNSSKLTALADASNAQVSDESSYIDASNQINWPQIRQLLAQNSSKVGLSFARDSANNDDDAACNKRVGDNLELTVVHLSLAASRNSDRGVYQLVACSSADDQAAGRDFEGVSSEDPSKVSFAANSAALLADADECWQSSVQVNVVDDRPQLQARFSSQLLSPNNKLSIKCEASGFTLPQITWYVDDQLLSESAAHLADKYKPSAGYGALSNADFVADLEADTRLLSAGRVRIGDYVSQDGHVHSFVNISAIQVTDSGVYKCMANNGLHSVAHESRIDVRGLPTIARQLSNISLLANEPFFNMKCPYAGYPVDGFEWLFRPTSNVKQLAASDVGSVRARRSHKSIQFGVSSADDEVDFEKDEWLQLASRQLQNKDEEQRNPDYPQFSVEDSVPSVLAADYLSDGGEFGLVSDSDLIEAISDDSDVEEDEPTYNDELFGGRGTLRQRRDNPFEGVSSEQATQLKLPQSRRHQVHANGTLTITQVSRADEGFYKCRVLRSPLALAMHEDAPVSSQQQQQLAVDSNEFHVTILVPPIISPFGSIDSLREGMRNFLTCSVIEGDAPVKIAWLKDELPIEEHIRARQAAAPQSLQPPIRVETNSNEFTSTLFFSQVDFSDSGNYTCV